MEAHLFIIVFSCAFLLAAFLFISLVSYFVIFSLRISSVSSLAYLQIKPPQVTPPQVTPPPQIKPPQVTPSPPPQVTPLPNVADNFNTPEEHHPGADHFNAPEAAESDDMDIDDDCMETN